MVVIVFGLQYRLSPEAQCFLISSDSTECFLLHYHRSQEEQCSSVSRDSDSFCCSTCVHQRGSVPPSLVVIAMMVSSVAVPPVTRGVSVPPSPLPCELNTSINCRDDVVPPLTLPRRHTHPPLSQPRKARNHGDGPRNQGDRHRRRRRTTSVRSSESVTAVSVAQPTRFQTPLVGGAKPSRYVG